MPCIGRQAHNHWTTREVPPITFQTRSLPPFSFPLIPQGWESMTNSFVQSTGDPGHNLQQGKFTQKGTQAGRGDAQSKGTTL